MDKDDINRNNNRNNPNYDPTQNNNNNNNTTLTLGLPTDLWRLITNQLEIDGDKLALVNKQLLQAWRSGVLGIRIWGCDLQDLNFLRTEFGGQRTTAPSFPGLRTLELYDHHGRRQSIWELAPPQDIPTQQDLSLRLHLKKSKLVHEVLELARSFPALAARVTHLQLGEWARSRDEQTNTPLATDYVAELVAAFPNLEELIVVGTPSFDGATHELLTQRSALKRLRLPQRDLPAVGEQRILMRLGQHPPGWCAETR